MYLGEYDDRLGIAPMALPLAAASGPAAPFVLAAVALASVFPFLGGLFRKDPDKASYDQLRQESWQNYKKLLDSANALLAQGGMDQNLLAQYQQAVSAVAADMKDYSDKLLAKGVDPDWLLPRFHDFYDVMQNKVNEWSRLAPTLPGAGILNQVSEFFESSSNYGPLLVAAAVVLALGSRRNNGRSKPRGAAA